MNSNSIKFDFMVKNTLYFFVVLMLSLSISTYAQEIGKKKSLYELKDEINPLNFARVNFYKNTLVFYNEYLDTESGSINTTDFRYTHPFKNRSWNFRTDIPLISGNTSSENKTAIGDISFSIAHIPYLTNKRGVSFRARITTNSSNNKDFGTGKWVFTPTVFYGQYLNKKGSVLWTTYLENKFSFAGSSNRANINAFALNNSINYSFSKSWISSDITVGYNQISEKKPIAIAFEYGTKFTPDTMLYFHPSFGIGSERQYNHGIEFGLVILY